MLTNERLLDITHRLGRAMADPNRAALLLKLLEQPGYPADLAAELNLTRANVSNHLACLKGCGIVAIVPEGRKNRYEIIDPSVATALQTLINTCDAILQDCQCQDVQCSANHDNAAGAQATTNATVTKPEQRMPPATGTQPAQPVKTV